MQDPPTEPHPTTLRLFLIFCRIGLTSFGGGISGWYMREFVRDRRWMSEEEFLTGLSLSQALPGVNVTNMSIWIGYRLLGPKGAAVGLIGMIVPPAILLILLATVFASLSHFHLTHLALTGAAAAAIGLSLSMGITAAQRIPRKAVPILVMVATFIAIGVLQWPLFWTVLGAGSISVALAYFKP